MKYLNANQKKTLKSSTESDKHSKPASVLERITIASMLFILTLLKYRKHVKTIHSCKLPAGLWRHAFSFLNL